MAGRARTARTLSHAQARAFYDRFGRLQDRQAFYEDVALDALVREGGFREAHAVVELGCGTGRLAHRLLRRELAPDARYVGLDVSATMVDLARRRLAPFGARAEVRRTDGALALPLPDRSHDRFIAAFVLDLLSDGDADLALAEAHRILAPGGRLCLASLTHGVTWASRALCRAWKAVHAVSPALVGGCRPVDVRPLLDPTRWTLGYCRTLTSHAVPMQVLIAARALASG